VRELKNLVARLVLTARGPEITVHDLPDYVRRASPADVAAIGGDVHVPPQRSPGEAADGAETLRERLEEVERQVLAQQARSCRSTYELGERIGMHQSSVVRKLQKYRISLGLPDGAMAATAGTVMLRERLEEAERQLLAYHARSCHSTYELADRIGVNQSSAVRKLHKFQISLGSGGAQRS
jgi:DNA-binding NtrC family response regulator